MKNIVVPVLFLVAAFSSCQKVINVKINSSASQYVIIGNITNEGGPYSVTINRSVDFQVDNNFPPVSGAKVAITDQTAGFTDTLAEITPGNYNTSSLAGFPGHTYFLYVNIDGQVFTALSTMPPVVNMDSLYQEPSEFGGGISIVPVYYDPGGVKNYYHFVRYINNIMSKNIIVRNDIINDGQTISAPLNFTKDTTIHIGDSVRVDLQAIDSAVYQYYLSLDGTISQNAAAPANPVTNITGAKLGYFSAHANSTKTILIHK